MNELCREVLCTLSGRTLVTAESCTGGGIGAALTAIAGSSEIYKGGVICYTNWVKENVLGVEQGTLNGLGAVSEPVAKQMACGVRKLLKADIAVSVTGLAGPGGDAYGNPEGTVYIGYCDDAIACVRHFQFSGNRESIRAQAVDAALKLILEYS